MSTLSAINLSELPAPDVIERLSYDDILAAMKQDLTKRLPDKAKWVAQQVEHLLDNNGFRTVIRIVCQTTC